MESDLVSTLVDKLKDIAQRSNEQDQHTLLFAVHQIEAAKMWKLLWAESEEKRYKLQKAYEELRKAYDDIRKTP